jgi:predicted phage terminase large subunit-like protein
MKTILLATFLRRKGGTLCPSRPLRIPTRSTAPTHCSAARFSSGALAKPCSRSVNRWRRSSGSASWDTANKPTELADYSVCTSWGVKGPRFYLLNVFRKKLAYPDLKRAVEQRALFNPSVILIEDKASGTQLIQELIEGGLSMVTRCKPDGDKIMRLHAQTATIENGFVHLPREARWLSEYVRELIIFPAGRFDDQVDSTSQALAWAKRRPPGWGIYEYARREAERAAGRVEQPLVQLKAPPGVTNVYTMSGRQIMVEDGYVSVPSDNAPFLLMAGFVRI